MPDNMPDNQHYNDTLRLARLIGLEYQHDEKTRVVERFEHEWVPWRPFERWDDIGPIRTWVAKNHPGWIAWSRSPRTPADCCLSVLAVFGSLGPDTLTPAECEVALAELAERLRAREAADAAMDIDIDRILASLCHHSSPARLRLPSVNYVRHWAWSRGRLVPVVIAAAAKIERLRVRLHEQTMQTQETATQIREQVIATLTRHGVLPDSLGHPIEQIVGRVVCDLNLKIERLNDRLHQAEAERDALRAEIADGDYWMERAKHYLANGGCPVCFSSDESGHERGCCWGQAESQREGHVEEIKRLRKAIQVLQPNADVLL